MKRKNKKILLGLTLIEMIITISIIAIMATIVVISMNPARQSAKLEAAQIEFASEVKLAKAYALQGKIQGSSTPCGYGIYAPASSSYFIFYNPPDGSKTCEQSNTDPNRMKYIAGVSGELPAKTLSDRIIVSGALYFKVPDATVYDGTGYTFEGSTRTFILTSLSGATAKVSVNGASQISLLEPGT